MNSAVRCIYHDRQLNSSSPKPSLENSVDRAHSQKRGARSDGSQWRCRRQLSRHAWFTQPEMYVHFSYRHRSPIYCQTLCGKRGRRSTERSDRSNWLRPPHFSRNAIHSVWYNQPRLYHCESATLVTPPEAPLPSNQSGTGTPFDASSSAANFLVVSSRLVDERLNPAVVALREADSAYNLLFAPSTALL